MVDEVYSLIPLLAAAATALSLRFQHLVPMLFIINNAFHGHSQFPCLIPHY